MATTPTQLPVPSEKPQDIRFNAGKIDEFVTSMGWTYTDRFGVKHHTIEGLKHIAEQAISAFGYVTMDSFEDGATLTMSNQVLRWKSNGEYYRWDGNFPKLVPAGSTPTGSGGVATGAWISVGDASLRTNIGSRDGLKHVGQCPAISDVRSIQFSSVGQQIFVSEHTLGCEVGGGIFYCHSMTSDETYQDDNGCQIINNYGQVIRRKDVTDIYLDYFCPVGGTYVDDAINNAYKATRTFRLPEIIASFPRNGLKYYLHGGIQFDMTDGLQVTLRGLRLGSKGVPFYHTGDNIAFRFFKNLNTNVDFWMSGGMQGIAVIGWHEADGSTTEGMFNYGASARALEVSDMWGATFKDLFIMKYYNNDGIRLYNDTGWTEGTTFENVMVRDCLVGWRFQRNESIGSTATDSFKDTQMIRCGYNAGIDASNTTIKVEANCSVYNPKIQIRFWTSGGAWHSIIRIAATGKMIDGLVELFSDGYGYSSTATTEVIHLIYCENRDAIYRCDTKNYSGQGKSGPTLERLQLLYNSLVYFDYLAYTIADDAQPFLNPKGAELRWSGSLTVEQQISGQSWRLSYLIPGTMLRMTITSYTDVAAPTVENWIVIVRGLNQPCIVIPEFAWRILATTNADALIDTTGTKSSFLKNAVQDLGHRYWSNDPTRTNLTLRNYNDDNSPDYLVNSGRQIRLYLPANASASVAMNYAVKLEFI